MRIAEQKIENQERCERCGNVVGITYDEQNQKVKPPKCSCSSEENNIKE